MIEIKERDEVFDMICQLSDHQVDPAVKKRLKGMMGKPNEEIKDELLGLLDDIAYCAWTSDFEIQVLHIVWRGIGGSDEELITRNRGLEIKENIKNWRSKYKWEAAHTEEGWYD